MPMKSNIVMSMKSMHTSASNLLELEPKIKMNEDLLNSAQKNILKMLQGKQDAKMSFDGSENGWI